MLDVVLAGFTDVQLERVQGSYQGREFHESVIAGIEVGLFFRDQGSHITKESPSVFIRKIVDGRSDEINDFLCDGLNQRSPFRYG